MKTHPALEATSAKPTTAKRQPKRKAGARPSADELAAFYADRVNSDGFLPANTISNTLRGDAGTLPRHARAVAGAGCALIGGES